MVDKIWTIVLVVLSIIALVLVGAALYVLDKPRSVDCENYLEHETDYKPIPKQCWKGEQNGR